MWFLILEDGDFGRSLSWQSFNSIKEAKDAIPDAVQANPLTVSVRIVRAHARFLVTLDVEVSEIPSAEVRHE
jgi:hypothetical protein